MPDTTLIITISDHATPSVRQRKLKEFQNQNGVTLIRRLLGRKRRHKSKTKSTKHKTRKSLLVLSSFGGILPKVVALLEFKFFISVFNFGNSDMLKGKTSYNWETCQNSFYTGMVCILFNCYVHWIDDTFR